MICILFFLTPHIYANESRESQDRQQDLAKVAFEKLHTTQLLEQAQSNITGIKSVLKVNDNYFVCLNSTNNVLEFGGKDCANDC